MSTEPDLHAIGIDESVAETRERLAGRNVPVIDDPAGASWGVYTDPSGAKVAFGRAEDGTEYTDANLESPHAYPAQGYRVSHNLAHFDLLESGDREGRFLAYVDNPTALTLTEPNKVTVRPAALGAEVVVYASEDEYKQAQSEHDGLTLDAKHLKSPWLLALHSGDATGDEASSVAMFAAVVQSAQLRTNELTGREFWYVLGESVVPMAIALPAETAQNLHPGAVIAGAFIIVASLEA